MRKARLPGRLATAALLLAAAACDIPTQIPKWSTLWVLPGDSAAIAVSSFVPAGVTVTPGGAAFELTLSSVTIDRMLEEMCGSACQVANGMTLPKPAFTSTFSSAVSLPADVATVSITSGRIDVRLSHNLSFDPLRPSATTRGFLVVTATRGSVTLARDSISGVDTAFPPNTTLSRVLNMTSATVDGPISIHVTVSSPAGDPIRIDTRQRLTIQVVPSQIRIAEARVRVPGTHTVTGPRVEMDLGDLDADLLDVVQGAALRLNVDNPFAVTGTLRLTFRTASRTIHKTAQLGAGSTSTRLEFTGEEIRFLLENPPVILTPSASYSAAGGLLSVRPSQVLRIHSRLELTLGAAR